MSRNTRRMPEETGAARLDNKKKPKKRFRALKITLTALLLCFVMVLAVVGGAMLGFIDNTTELIANDKNLDFSSILYYIDAETGQPVEMERLYAKQNREWVDLNQIPENLKNAFIAIEDERFESHRGVDWKRTFGAFLGWITGNSSYGGSTITQQLIKNVTGDDARSPIRKIQEIIRALNLERKMSKDQIIEMYMNTIFLGEGCHGVQTASNVYFSKDVSELTLAECASIAGITQYPSKYDPLINFEEHKKKQELVLDKMLELGYISQEECDAAKAEQLALKKGTTNTEGDVVQSYFVDMVIDDVVRDLMAKEKMSESQATKMVYQGGLKIYTTEDPKVQAALEEVYTNDANFPKYPGEAVPQSAMIVMDPYTGHIKGVVGGRGEKAGDRVLNRATQTLRQPGSSIKPLSVYAPAMEAGLITPATIVNDGPIQIGDWSPKNSYSGFLGDITVQTALEKSSNLPAIKILDKLTVDRSFQFMTNNLGFTTMVSSEIRKDGKTYSDKYLSSLALGGLTDGVSVKEMCAAYQPFVNSGVYTKPVSYTKVIDPSGQILLENKQESSNAMSAVTAYSIAQMLAGATRNGTGQGANLSNGIFTAGKTGTTDDNYDRWFVGFTPYYVGAAWFGFDQPQAVSGNPALTLWHKVMEIVHEDLPDKDLQQPDNVSSRVICQQSGKIAQASCENVRTCYFKPGTEPNSICNSHATSTPEDNPDKVDDTIVHEDTAVSENPENGETHTNPPVEGQTILPSASAPASDAPATNSPASSAVPQTDATVPPEEDDSGWWSGEE